MRICVGRTRENLFYTVPDHTHTQNVYCSIPNGFDAKLSSNDEYKNEHIYEGLQPHTEWKSTIETHTATQTYFPMFGDVENLFEPLSLILFSG